MNVAFLIIFAVLLAYIWHISVNFYTNNEVHYMHKKYYLQLNDARYIFFKISIENMP